METPYYSCEAFLPHLGNINIMAQHFYNEILLTVRLNAMMNYTLEVSRQGLRSLEQDTMLRPIAGIYSDSNKNNTSPESKDTVDELDAQEELFIRDNLSDYSVVVKLGDPNNNKLIVISTQIAELYYRVILPQIERKLPMGDGISAPTLIITLNSLIWENPRDNNANNHNNLAELDSTQDFNKLVVILRSIKQMYNL